MHFQIFIPGVYGGDPGALNKVGLADLNDGRAQCVPTDGTHGPDGQGGLCVAWPRADQMRYMGCQPDRQTWVPAVPSHDGEAGRYWVGFWNDSPPTPAELMRRQTLRGESVTLGDGGQWLVPCYRTLPQDVIPTGDGNYTFRPKERFLGVFEMGQLWAHRLLKQAEGVPWGDAVDAIIALLKLNYRMTPEVLGHLRLIDTDNALRPILAFLGEPQDLANFTPGGDEA